MCLLMGGLMIWASVSKLAHPTEFLASLLAYQLPVRPLLLKGLAMALPWIELLCGLLLLANFWTAGALLFCRFLFSSFLLATG